MRGWVNGRILAVMLMGWVGLYAVAAWGQDLLVANYTYPFEVKRFDSTGTAVGPGGTFAVDASMSFPRGIAYGPDGNLYVANEGTGDIQKYNGTTGAFISTFIAGSAGLLEGPKGIAFDSTGDHLIVASNASPNGLLRYDADTGSYVDNLLASLPDGVSISSPWGVAIGPDGDIFCSGAGTGNLLRFDGTSGAFISEFIPPGTGGLSTPHGIAFGPDDDLYIAEYGVPSLVRKYDGDTGASLGVFITSGSGGLSRADFLTFGPDDNLYISSEDTHNILRYDGATGGFIDIFATGSGLYGPSGLTFMPVPEPTSLSVGAFAGLWYLRRVRQH